MTALAMPLGTRRTLGRDNTGTPILGTRPGSVDDLLDPVVRARYRIAYHPGIADLATSEHAVLANPSRVQWLTVTNAVMSGPFVTYTAGGREFRDFGFWPVVLGLAG